MRKTDRPPWHGMDAASDGVATCDHRWVDHRLGDVLANTTNPNERMVFCARCYVPRCLVTGRRDNGGGIMAPGGEIIRCQHPRHHNVDHLFVSADGADAWTAPVGGGL